MCVCTGVCISAADSYLHSHFRGGHRKTHVFRNRVHNGHSRPSKVVDCSTNRKRICDFLLVIKFNSNRSPILPRFRDIAGFLLRTATPASLIPPKFLGHSLGLYCDVGAPRSKDPKLIIPVINFELVQSMCPRYLNVTDGRTDRWTDGRLTIAIPRFALYASRGKNAKKRKWSEEY